MVTDLVTVYTKGAFTSQAACSCGWRKRRRPFLGWAVFDAHMHSVETRHEPAWPLVVGVEWWRDLDRVTGRRAKAVGA